MSKRARLEKRTVLPAHETKHVAELSYTFENTVFRLAQLDNGISNGTALWLGAQCLSAYLAQVYSNKRRTKLVSTKRPRVIELGSGIGLSAYVSKFDRLSSIQAPHCGDAWALLLVAYHMIFLG